MKSNKSKKPFSSLFYAVTTAILFTFVILETYIIQSQKNITYSIAENFDTKTPITKTTPAENPVEIDSIKPNSQIISPFKLTGKIDSSWMFEGSFPVKLLDENRKVLLTTVAKETVGGSWMKPGKVSFSAQITFKTTAKTGYLVLESDNPKGDSATKKQYEMPIRYVSANTNLKTYLNNNLNVTFKYPATMSLTAASKSSNDLLNLQINTDLNFYVSHKGMTECEAGCQKIYKTETVKALNATFVKYYLTPSKQVLNDHPNALMYAYETKNQDKVYGFSALILDRNDVNNLKITNDNVSDIINTFKLLNAATASSTKQPLVKTQ